MTKFISNTLIFAFPIFLVVIIMEILLRQIPNDYLFKKEYLDTHSKEIETLILGSSHSFYGINPIYFSSNAFNASHISQSPDYDFEIYKKYRNNLGNLKTIILEISYSNLFSRLETGAESWRIKNYVIYYDMKVSNSLRDHLEITSNRFSVNLRRLGSYYIKDNSNISCTELGWGTNAKSENANDLNESGKTAALRHTAKDFDYYGKNITTLKLFIESCKRQKINIILIAIPAYKTYLQNLNTEQLEKTVETANELAKEYNNCQFINLLESTEFDENDFYDADHLNEIGAKKLSLLINKLIDKA